MNLRLLLGLLILLTACAEVPGNKPEALPIEYAQKFAGLSAKTWVDSNGHMHVFSETDLGMNMGFGYVHAKERAWQLDYFRRVAQGRTSEVHGYQKLKTDVMMRLMGLYERANKLAKELDPQTREWLWSYAYGVNKAFQETDFSKIYEFKKLGYKPLAWTPTDTIALILLQSFDQTRETFIKEVRETEWLKKLNAASETEGKDLFIDDNLPWDTSILKKGEYTEAQTASATQESSSSASKASDQRPSIQELYSFFDTGEQIGIGSNNWVISPKLSQSGHALLENDPHLHLKSPSFWYWAHVQGPKSNAMGASFPGIPMITSGLNENVAWGLTNSYLDTGKISYISEDLLVRAKNFRPTIWINFYGLQLPFVFKNLRRLEDHPILPIDAPPGKALVLDWTGFSIAPEHIAALHLVQSSKSVQDSISTFQQVDIPSWNFVFADTKGNIGYTASGRILKHVQNTPFGITEMKHGQNLNGELLEKSETPQLLNPKRGFIATANNRQWPKEAKWHGGYAYRSSFRAFRIEELLKNTSKHDLNTMKATACDIYATDARFFRPLLLGHLKQMKLKPQEFEASKKLESWSLMADAQCEACGIYRRTLQRLVSYLGTNDQHLYRWLKNGNAKEVAKVLGEEFPKALSDMKKAKPSSVELPKWGEIHRNYFRHLSDDSRFFNNQFVSTPGDDNTINPGTSDWKDEGYFEQTAGSSMRFIVELSTPPKAIVQLAGVNTDNEALDFESENSGFKKWSQCSFTDAQFPLDWSKVEAKSVEF